MICRFCRCTAGTPRRAGPQSRRGAKVDLQVVWSSRLRADRTSRSRCTESVTPAALQAPAGAGTLPQTERAAGRLSLQAGPAGAASPEAGAAFGFKRINGCHSSDWNLTTWAALWLSAGQKFRRDFVFTVPRCWGRQWG